jgi:CheY-like chemotaxis protein
MGHTNKVRGTSADESFVRWLRQALRYLYDPGKLRRNPLFGLLGLAESESSSALRNILVNGIEALKPDASVSPQSEAWRTYRILLHRYVDQFSQGEVATNLGLSVRQLRRQESLALRVLADHLWVHCDLQLGNAGQEGAPVKRRAEDALGDARMVSREQELAWLERSLPSELTDVAQIMRAVLKTVGPLIKALGTRVRYELPEDLPNLTVQQTTMRQALLNVLTTAIRSAPGGQVDIHAKARASEVWISVQPIRQRSASPSSEPENHVEGLEMAQQLVALSGGSLEVRSDQDSRRPFTARFILPGARQLAVQVIDDNADTLRLFQHYLADSRYSFVGTQDPERALALAEKSTPQIIVADVMLPGIDGWELLGRLREHPKIRNVPIIVCTILPEEQLALTLGAAAFLRKPFTRGELLAVLDRQAESLTQESG